MFSIGEFSRISGLTVKTLRFYHDQELLAPASIDPDSGYRYYNDDQISRARIIGRLRELDFSLREIGEILAAEDDADVLSALRRHKSQIDRKTASYRRISKSLDAMIENGLEARKMIQEAGNEVIEKTVNETLIAGIRMRGKYRDCGPAFGRIGRRFGRHICGKPIMLIYDTEYKEDDADFEVCMPVRKGADVDEIKVYQLSGGRFLSVMHHGPYDEVGQSYERILKYAKQNGMEVEAPCREIYIKGPGMIFRGNPENYLTEVQMLIADPS